MANPAHRCKFHSPGKNMINVSKPAAAQSWTTSRILYRRSSMPAILRALGGLHEYSQHRRAYVQQHACLQRSARDDARSESLHGGVCHTECWKTILPCC